MIGTDTQVQYSKRHDATIDDYQQDFARIWQRDLHERSVLDLWLHVVDHASKVSRAVRLDDTDGVIDDLADTAAWLMSFIAQCRSSSNPIDQHFRIDKPTSDIIWEKFPGQCATCFDAELLQKVGNLRHRSDEIPLLDAPSIQTWLTAKARTFEYASPCGCLSRVPAAIARRDIDIDTRNQLDSIRIEYASRLRRAGHKPRNIVDFEHMFDHIFKSQQRNLPLDKVAFHLLEEVGDATRALKDCYTFDAHREQFSQALLSLRIRRLSEELADIFSWMFAMLLKVRLMQNYASKYAALLQRRSIGSAFGDEICFSDVLWHKYGTTIDGSLWATLRCPGCENSICECPRQMRIVWLHSDSSRDRTKELDRLKKFDTYESPNSTSLSITPIVVVNTDFVASASSISEASASANIDFGAVAELYRLATQEQDPSQISNDVSRLVEMIQQSRQDTDRILKIVVELLQHLPAERRATYVKRLKQLLGGLGISLAGSATFVPLEPEIKQLLEQIGLG